MKHYKLFSMLLISLFLMACSNTSEKDPQETNTVVIETPTTPTDDKNEVEKTAKEVGDAADEIKNAAESVKDAREALEDVSK